MSLRSTDLNLLPILQALLRHESVSRASGALGLSQPATSNALARLRILFGDPLLVRVGRRMQLTRRARNLLPHLSGVCTEIESLLQQPEFDPAFAEQTFMVATPDYIALLIVAEIMESLRKMAPRITVQFVDPRSDYAERLLDNKYDLAIVGRGEQNTQGLSVSRGYPDRLVGVVCDRHPLAGRRPTLESLGAYPKLRFGIETRMPEVVTALQRPSLNGHTRIVAEQLMILPLLAAQSDCIAVVPGALAEYFKKFMAITMFELPGDGWAVDACMLWSPARDADPAHGWFRDLVDTAMNRRLSWPGAGRQLRD